MTTGWLGWWQWKIDLCLASIGTGALEGNGELHYLFQRYMQLWGGVLWHTLASPCGITWHSTDKKGNWWDTWCNWTSSNQYRDRLGGAWFREEKKSIVGHWMLPLALDVHLGLSAWQKIVLYILSDGRSRIIISSWMCCMIGILTQCSLFGKCLNLFELPSIC